MNGRRIEELAKPERCGRSEGHGVVSLATAGTEAGGGCWSGAERRLEGDDEVRWDGVLTGL